MFQLKDSKVLFEAIRCEVFVDLRKSGDGSTKPPKSLAASTKHMKHHNITVRDGSSNPFHVGTTIESRRTTTGRLTGN